MTAIDSAQAEQRRRNKEAQARFQSSFPDASRQNEDGTIIWGAAADAQELEENEYGQNLYPNSPSMTGARAVVTAEDIGADRGASPEPTRQGGRGMFDRSPQMFETGTPAQDAAGAVLYPNSPGMTGTNRNSRERLRAASIAAREEAEKEAHDPSEYRGTKLPSPPSPFDHEMPRGMRKAVEANARAAELQESARKRRR